MAVPPLDRLLKTCIKRDALCMHLKVGSPPGIQLADGWRGLQLPPLEQDDLNQIAWQLRCLGRRTRDRLARLGLKEEGIERFQLSYGREKQAFRIVLAERTEGIWLVPLRDGTG